jgi:hypothetical protein
MKFDIYIGKKYERLTVLRFDSIKGKRRHYECECACGNKKVINIGNLRRGLTKSCGCLYKEWNAAHIRKDSTKRKLFDRYQRKAKKKGYIFQLTFEEFIKLTSENCFYCGKTPSSIITNGKQESYVYNGIDRKDNNNGYILQNSLACCSNCNFFKRSLNYDYFLEMIKKIYNFNFNKGIKFKDNNI